MLAVIAGALASAIVIIARPDPAPIDRSGSSEPLATTPTAPPTTPISSPVEITSTLPNRDPALLPAGLLCRDLHAAGYSYAAAVTYWRREGQPDRMDTEKNGIPCETVYPLGEVQGIFPAATVPVTEPPALPSGLLCRDLHARTIDVYGAIDYYVSEGSPDRMDADGNGIPCGTVYPDAAAGWRTLGACQLD